MKILLSIIFIIGYVSMLLGAYFGTGAVNPLEFWVLVVTVTTLSGLGLFGVFIEGQI